MNWQTEYFYLTENWWKANKKFLADTLYSKIFSHSSCNIYAVHVDRYIQAVEHSQYLSHMQQNKPCLQMPPCTFAHWFTIKLPPRNTEIITPEAQLTFFQPVSWRLAFNSPQNIFDGKHTGYFYKLTESRTIFSQLPVTRTVRSTWFFVWNRVKEQQPLPSLVSSLLSKMIPSPLVP